MFSLHFEVNILLTDINLDQFYSRCALKPRSHMIIEYIIVLELKCTIFEDLRYLYDNNP